MASSSAPQFYRHGLGCACDPRIGLSATARSAISISASLSPTRCAEITEALANVSDHHHRCSMPTNKPNCFLAVELGIVAIAPKDVEHVTDTCQNRGRAEPRVKLQGAMSQRYRLGILLGSLGILGIRTEIKIICSEALRSPPRCHFQFLLKQFWLNG